MKKKPIHKPAKIKVMSGNDLLAHVIWSNFILYGAQKQAETVRN